MHVRVKVSGSLKTEVNPFLHKDQQSQNSVTFATSQPKKSPFGQQTSARECESKPKALTQQFVEVTLLFILCHSKGMLLCSEGQSLTGGWTPAELQLHLLPPSNEHTCSWLSGKSSSASLPQKSWYGQQLLQNNLRKLNNTIPIHRPL